jgi:hypothetical protein
VVADDLDRLFVLQPGQQDPAPERGHLDRIGDRFRGHRRQFHDRRRAAAGQLADSPDQVVLLVDVDHLVGTDRSGRLETEAISRRAGDDDLANADLARGVGGGDQTHVARPLDHEAIPLVQPEQVRPVHDAGERLEQAELGGRYVVGQRHEMGPGEDPHELAVAAPQAMVDVGPDGVAVDVEADAFASAEEDEIDTDALTDLDAERRVRRQGVDATDDLVAGHDRRDLTRHVLVPVELRHIAGTQANGLHGEHGTTGRRFGSRELPQLVGTITREHDPATRRHRRNPLSSNATDGTHPATSAQCGPD